jgi:NADPH-dependent 2,4-dienoyl-CoA reductase/sulfur reductase-like enzyme
MNYSIIGGSDAGISAALRIKEIDKHAQVDMFLADEYPNYSICGIPFYLSKEINHLNSLAHRSVEEILSKGIGLHTNHTIHSIDVANRQIAGNNRSYHYDKLLIGTGAVSLIPPIQGVDLPGVFTLRWIGDMLRIEEYILQHQVNNALIIGGGYIGLEMADALIKRGLRVTLVEALPQVLTSVDLPLAEMVRSKLQDNGVNVFVNTKIEEIESIPGKLKVHGTNDFGSENQLVLIAVGVQPETSLVHNIEKGFKGAIKTNRKMETSVPNIYAAGDCIETYHAFLKENVYLPLGSTAHKQGRIAGENMAGGHVEYQGSLGSQVVKIFDLVVGRTGLNDKDCEKYNLPYRTVSSELWDHKHYYPGARQLTIRITGNPDTEELYGAQIIGHTGSEISKRIDIIATAIHNNYRVPQLNDIDLTYTPTLSSPWDPVQMAAQKWTTINKGNREK